MPIFGRRENQSLGTDRLESIRRRNAGPTPEPASDSPRTESLRTGADAPRMEAPKPETGAGFAHLLPQLREHVAEKIGATSAVTLPRKDIAAQVGTLVGQYLSANNLAVPPVEIRGLVTALVNTVIDDAHKRTGKAPAAPPAPKRHETRTAGPTATNTVTATYVVAGALGSGASRSSVEEAASRIQVIIMDRIDVAAAAQLPRKEIAQQISEIVGEILAEQKIQLNQIEQRDLITLLLNEMLGLGPLEALLADDTVNDIMVNGAKNVYVERKGKLELTDVKFRDDSHVMNIATRIVTGVGRRVDESSPLVDARLADGSRVNIIIPPLAIDGPSISIRKFSKKGITLDVMSRQGNISEQMATVLKIAARARLNILISGGTGSGKTTLLNALSQMIDGGDRIVTIEDAAELQLQQPHVVRLETRPANLEGEGEITMRDLVKNALRMRPDRIILGEVRGSEAVDMLQAMNTGHEGSLGTVHANRPREALTRLENMIGLAGINLPAKAVRTQIAAALDMIVQVSRMRDGMRRVTHIVEVVGMEGDIITTQELFTFEFEGEGTDGMLRGQFKPSGLRPHFTPKAEYFGLEKALLESMS
ncbi:MAG: CpaF family protein [Alphaproteobacteria bacterium]